MADIWVERVIGSQTSSDGKVARLVFKDHDGQEHGLIFPVSHLDAAAEIFVELLTSLEITGALADRNASNELKSAPDLHRIVEVTGIVERPESAVMDLELRTAHGTTLQLCFEPTQLQRLARRVLTIEEPEEIAGEQ